MKLLVLFLLISISAVAQGNLKNENGQIVWQKVYDSDLSETEIKEIMAKNSSLNPISNTLSGDSKPVDLQCEETQAIFMDDDMFFFAIIDIKEGRYRVTVKNIRLIPSNTVKIWGVESSDTPNPYEEIMVKNNGELRSNKLAQNSMECINKYLQTLFDFKKSEDDW